MQCTQVLLNSLIQCNKSCTDVRPFTLTQKYSFNHIFKLEQKKYFLEYVICGFYGRRFCYFVITEDHLFFYTAVTVTEY